MKVNAVHGSVVTQATQEKHLFTVRPPTRMAQSH